MASPAAALPPREKASSTDLRTPDDADYDDNDDNNDDVPEPGTPASDTTTHSARRDNQTTADANREAAQEDPPEDGTDGTVLAHRTTTGSSYLSAKLSLPHEIAFVATVCCAQLVTQAGLGQMIAIMDVVAETFHIEDEPGQIAWLIAAYSLTVGSFILMSGRVGDMFGHKRMMVVGFWWYAVWSVATGLGWYGGRYLFVVGRALQGLGASILLPNGLALLGAAYPPGRRKNMVFACFGGVAPGGSIVGAVFAALLARAWWPWAFFSFGIGLFALGVISILVIPDPPPQLLLRTQTSRGGEKREGGGGSGGGGGRRTLRETIVEMDLAGAFLGVCALIAVNVAWNQAPIDGWDTPYVYVVLLVGFALAGAFFYYEMCVARFPLVPLRGLGTPVAFVLACMACGWGCFGVWVFYLWRVLLTVRQLDPLLATAWMSPVLLVGAVAACTTGVLLHRVGPEWTMVCALTAFAVGTVLVATLPAGVHGQPGTQPYWAQAFLATVVTPFGMDMSFPAGTVIVSNAMPRRHQGVGASLVNTVVNYSIALALGFAGTAEVYANRGGRTPGDTLHGYRVALYVGIGLAGLGWLLSLAFLARGYVRRK